MRLLYRCAALILAAALSTASHAADKNYTKGTVWSVAMIKTEPGKQDDYIDSLKQYYVSVYEEAIKQKVVVSYKILTGVAANPGDWDILILIEMPNYAAIDTIEAKIDAIEEKFAGSQAKADENAKKLMGDRAPIRHIYGDKLMQELHFVK